MCADFSKTAGDYGRYRPAFPESFFERLASFGIGLENQRVLDLGTGTGSLARAFAARAFAARGCRVTGIDLSGAMLEEARRLDRDAGVRVSYAVTSAEDTGLPDDSFDVVAAGQCWHWFDRQIAAGEAMRVLRLGGSLIVCHFDPIPMPGDVMETTAELIGLHNPKAKDTAKQTGFYPDWLKDVVLAGFIVIETFTFDVFVPHTHERWRGRMRASAAIGASLESGRVERFDEELGKLLRERFPREPLEVRHRVFALVCRAP